MKRYHTVLTHRLHLDEVVAIVIAMIFGSRRNMDVTEAKIELVYGNHLPDGKTVAELDREGILCIGEGGGRFDEHGRKDASKTCAALLMARYLGVANHPGLKSILAEVCEFDRNATATKTAIGTIIKTRFIAGSHAQGKVIEWAIMGVRDMLTWSIQEGSISCDYEAYSAVFSKAWQHASEHGVWTDDMYQRAARDFQASAENSQRLITDLSYIYFYRVAQSGKEKADEWLYDAAYDLIIHQKKFSKACADFIDRAHIEKTTALVEGREACIKVAFIESDSAVMDKAYRSSQAVKRFGLVDCLVQRKSSGNVGIYLNHRSKLYCDDLARMLRWTEIYLTSREPHGWEKLNKAEDLEFVPEWYYHRTEKVGESAIYNGSLTHPHVKPTRLSNEDLVVIVRHAFHPEGVRIWRRRHGAFDKPKANTRIEPKAQAKDSARKMEPGFEPDAKIDLGQVMDKAVAQ